jgi:hypothetical protein
MASNQRQTQQTPYVSPFQASQDRLDWEYTSECLDEVCWLSGGSPHYYSSECSMTPPTPNWMKEGQDNYWDSDDSEYEEQPQTINAEAQAGAFQPAPLVTASSTPSAPVYNPNDPLRYFLENGEIAESEYEKWKLVKEEPHQREAHQCQPTKYRRKTPDYGPGYNSDNDTDSDGFETTEDGTILIYGTGYSKQFNDGNYRDKRVFDPWNPAPDPTSNKRYTKVANDHAFMRSRLTFAEQYCDLSTHGTNQEDDATTNTTNTTTTNTNAATKRKLSDSFELKIIWERFMSAEASSSTPNLQNFWQENALITYEALQNLRADQNRRQARAWRPHPEYHTTPIETLETTFETIGRMCRCISDDFNTQSVLDYVDEFIVMLYREIEFNALVEAH